MFWLCWRFAALSISQMDVRRAVVHHGHRSPGKTIIAADNGVARTAAPLGPGVFDYCCETVADQLAFFAGTKIITTCCLQSFTPHPTEHSVD